MSISEALMRKLRLREDVLFFLLLLSASLVCVVCIEDCRYIWGGWGLLILS